jgi:hypothetical protein
VTIVITIPHSLQSKSISASRRSIALLVITKGVVIQERWFAELELGDITIGIFESGYSNNTLSFLWLQHFDRLSKPENNEKKLLICHGTSFPLTEGLGTNPHLPRYLSDRSHDLLAVYIARPLWPSLVSFPLYATTVLPPKSQSSPRDIILDGYDSHLLNLPCSERGYCYNNSHIKKLGWPVLRLPLRWE